MPSTCRAQALELSEPQAAALAEGAAILAANRKPVPPYRQPSPLATEGDAVPGFYAKWLRAQQEAEQRRVRGDKEAETEVLTEVGCSTDTDTDEMFEVEESGGAEEDAEGAEEDEAEQAAAAAPVLARVS